MEERMTNSTFELKNIVDTSTENAAFAAAFPSWLRELDKFRTSDWATAVRELTQITPALLSDLV